MVVSLGSEGTKAAGQWVAVALQADLVAAEQEGWMVGGEAALVVAKAVVEKVAVERAAAARAAD